MIKRLLLVCVILSIVFTMAACTAGNKKIETEPAEIHLLLPFPSFPDPYFEGFKKLFQDTADNYHELNPQITVVIDQLSVDDFSVSGIVEQLKGDAPPDLVPFSVNELEAVRDENLLLDLLPLHDLSGSTEIDIAQPILETAKSNGELLILPFRVDPRVVIYNKEFFSKSNVAPPVGDWTWDQYNQTALQIDPSGKSIFPYMPNALYLLLEGAGNSMISPDRSTFVGYLDNQAAVREVQRMNGYYRDAQKTAPEGFMGASNEFIEGKFGMNIGDYFSYSIYKQNLGDRLDLLGVAPLPHLSDGRRVNDMEAVGFGISAKSKHSQEAWKFLEFFALTDHQNAARFAEYYLSPSKSVREALKQAEDPAIGVFDDEMNYAIKPFANGPWNEQNVRDFADLITASDEEIPGKLHDLAMNLDSQLAQIKSEQMTSQD